MICKFKKRADLTLTELIGLVLAFFVIVFFFIPLGARIYKYFQQVPNQEIINSLERLASEINTLSATFPEKIVPFYLEENYVIVVFNAVDQKLPLLCKAESCLCIVNKNKQTVQYCVQIKNRFTKHDGLKVLEISQGGGEKGIINAVVRLQGNLVDVSQKEVLKSTR